MKGIILAGGTGSRLYPVTKAINKHLLHLYNKPLIYYSLSVLFLSKIKKILIIVNRNDYNQFYQLLGDGKKFGVNFEYAFQDEPNGIAEAFIIGKKFIGDDSTCLVLGDNIFFGQGFLDKLINAKKNIKKIKNSSTIFAYKVNNPKEYGIVEFDNKNKAIRISEKPKNPKSNFAITGLYFYSNCVTKKINKIKKSKRNELEISDVNKIYLKENKLYVEDFGRGFGWFDAGTFNGLKNASSYIEMIEKRQNLMIGCLEEIACRNKWITKEQLMKIGLKHKNSEYGKYLIDISKKI